MKELLVKIGIAVIVLTLLPSSPFQAFLTLLQSVPYLDVLNWFIPVGEIIVVLEVWISAIAMFYMIQVVLNYVGLLKG